MYPMIHKNGGFMRNLTLLTDLYELTMMQGYFKTDNNRTVIFDAFHRKNPCDGAYAISCGLEQVIDYIKNLHFTCVVCLSLMKTFWNI